MLSSISCSRKAVRTCLTLLCLLVVLMSALPSSVSADAVLYYSAWDVSGDGGSRADGIALKASEKIEASGTFDFDFRLSYYDELTDGAYPKVSDVPIELGFTANLMPFDSFNPFLTTAAGYHFMSGGGASNKFGFLLGGGFEWGDPKGMALFCEIVYRWVNSTTLRVDNQSYSFSPDGVNGNIGISFRW